MSGDWQGSVFSYPSRRENEEQGLGLDTSSGGSYYPGPGGSGYGQYGESSTSQNAGFRPSLNLDTSGPSFQHPQIHFPSAQSSAPPSGMTLDASSIHTGDRLITPGMQYGFNGFNPYQPPDPNFSAGQLPFSGSDNILEAQQRDDWFQSLMAAGNFFHPHFVPPPSAQPPNTINPHQFAPHDLSGNQPKLFTNLLMESRGSTSSASSTDGHDWHDEWQNMTNTGPSRPRNSSVQGPSGLSQSMVWPSGSPPNGASGGRSPAAPLNEDEIKAAIRGYLSAPSRLAHGERKIVISSPKVGQKSYGTEKRFLCPHPQATLYGTGWWPRTSDGCPVATALPPRLHIALAGETPPKESTVSWSTIDGHNLDEKINTQAIVPDDKPFMGHVAGKNLHITDSDSKRKEVKAVVTIRAPLKHHAGPNGWGHTRGTLEDIDTAEVVGTFESKEIKVISKPSKKKASSKSGELLVQHGSTVALFNRVKSQTTSTRYLSIQQDNTTVLGSDGRPATGAQPPMPLNAGSAWQSFTASANAWESWIIWCADPRKPATQSYNLPLQPGWPSAPANALTVGPNPPAIRYNSLVILQSIQTGRCTPILIIRRVDQDADVVGGDGSSSELSGCYPDGELGGDLVAQLQKCAFEVYRPDTMMQLSRDPRYGGFWLACDQDMIQERYVNHPRRWSSIPTPPSRGSVGRPASVPSTPQQRFGVLPMTPHLSNGTLPSTPSSPVSTSSSLEYFGAHSRKPSSTSLVSPNIGHGDVPLPMDGGPMRRQRAGSSNRGPLVRPTHKKRQSTDSTSTSWETLASSSNGAPSFGFHGKSSLSPDLPRSMWTLDVGETCVWSIVSTEQKTYTFYVPPQATNAPTPYTPFPEIIRYLPPGQAGSDPLPGHAPHQTYTTLTNLPLITIYGRNFVPKPERGSSDFKVFYGDQMAEHTEVRCPEVMAASEPTGPIRGPVPITLVREDGHCFVPTNVLYTPRSTPGAP